VFITANAFVLQHTFMAQWLRFSLNIQNFVVHEYMVISSQYWY